MFKLDEMTIIDNFLDEKEANHLESFITSKQLQWRMGESLDHDCPRCEILMPSLYDRHLVYFIYSKYYKYDKTVKQKENDFKITSLFLKKLGMNSKNMLSIKINSNFCKEGIYRAGWHIDPIKEDVGKGLTAIYYVNTNNGKTLFKNGNEAECVKNRMVIFPNTWYHTPQYQTDTPVRSVINFNWLTDL